MTGSALPGRATAPTGASPADIRRALRHTFGLTRLREPQREVIDRVLAGRGTLALMPTGAGKSLCYQLPAVLQRGRTVVVSPLIALMKDQCDTLRARSVAAVRLHSGLPAPEAEAAWRSIEDGSARIVFTTPEQLAQADFIAALQSRPVQLLVVDEAHCIAQWGFDFRPAFSAIGPAIEAPGRPTVLALTATATPAVADEIVRSLGLPADGVIRGGSLRPNLHYRVENFSRAEDKIERLLALARAAAGSGIVYAATVKAAEALHGALEAADESVALYHGRLPARQRHAAQEAFMAGRARVMVATNAFGLGIDKPDIRFVLHHQLPAGLDAYYQESGRAGRDGEPAVCTLLHVAGDRSVQQFFLANRYPSLADFEAFAVSVAAPAVESVAAPDAQGADAALPARTKKFTVIENLLRAEGLQATVGSEIDAQAWLGLVDRLRAKATIDRTMLERMAAYAQSGHCRWRLLLEGLESTDAVERCGTCDNCRRMAQLDAQRAAALSEPADAAADDAPRGAEMSASEPRFVPGERVRTRRHGVAEVVAADALSVTVRFDNGVTRSFQPQFVVRPAARRGRPPRLRVAPPEADARPA